MMVGFALTRMPAWLAPLYLLGRRERLNGHAMDPKAQLVGQFSQSIRVPGQVPTPEEGRAQTRRMVELMDAPGPTTVATEDRTIPGPAGDLPVRIYTPAGGSGRPLPVLCFLHGGGWVQGDLETHHHACLKLVDRAGCLIMAVDYRLAPEHKFPAAVEDCLAAYRWLTRNAAEIGGDPARVGVGGDSAGGNLAAVVSQQTAAAGEQAPACQVLIYPATDFTMSTPSHNELREAYIIPRDRMDWYAAQYLNDPSEMTDLRVSPLLAEDLSGQPPTLMLTGGFDPLRDEGRQYADRLSAAGIPVTRLDYDGQIHAFVILTAVIPEGDRALSQIADYLRQPLVR